MYLSDVCSRPTIPLKKPPSSFFVAPLDSLWRSGFFVIGIVSISSSRHLVTLRANWGSRQSIILQDSKMKSALSIFCFNKGCALLAMALVAAPLPAAKTFSFILSPTANISKQYRHYYNYRYHCNERQPSSLCFASINTGDVEAEPKAEPKSNEESINTSNLQDPADMKLRDIQAELKGMSVSYADCFDRDSLSRRLLQARTGEVKSDINVDADADEPAATCTPPATEYTGAEPPLASCTTEESANSSSTPTNSATKATSPTSSSTTTTMRADFDRDATLVHLRSLRVKELRTECGTRNIRWANMLEKEDLMQAVLKAMESAAHFSVSGSLTPGQVADINSDDLTAELVPGALPTNTPLLLDVDATWCGPCQMMSKELVAAAAELGDSVRVAKIDSDKYPDWASRLKVGGLPTVIVFQGNTAKEVERVEGALMKDGLVKLARKHV